MRLVAVLAAVLTLALPATAGAVEGGEVHPRAGAVHHGDTTGRDLKAPVVGIAGVPSGRGYWQVASDGGVFGFGDARFHGSTGGMRLNRPIVGAASSPSGGGYWLVASDGGIFSFGDATFLGSTGAMRLNAPIVGMERTPSGRGYWLVASDGGIFSFGDARFAGSTGSMRLVSPIVDVAATPTGGGYWLLAGDGGVFTFGDAVFAGSAAGKLRPERATAIVPSPSGLGYRVTSSDGFARGYGDVADDEGAARACKPGPVVAADRGAAAGFWLTTSAPRSAQIGANTHPVDVVAAESANIAEVLRHRQGCQPAAQAAQGRLANPLPGARVTSGYGSRIHPIYGRRQHHDGIDLAGGGSSIRAAADGTVVQVATRQGYGVTTLVDHGDGVATVYAHQARAAVAAGQRVARGQVIGTVGTTGFATGPHLHWEVRVKGSPTEPRAWW
jgi:murein DD-endopeptidase MepM/ murein hydrolase activator NlpD